MDADIDQAAEPEDEEEVEQEVHQETKPVAELQRAEQGSVNRGFSLWDLAFGRRNDKPSSGSSAAPAPAPAAAPAPSSSSGSGSSSDSEHQEAGRGALEPAKQRLTDASGSGSSGLKDSIAAGGAEAGLPKTGEGMMVMVLSKC
jgi:hypothetical protein